MTEQNSFRNIAILLILTLVFAIPSFFVKEDLMRDLVSAPMIIFGVWALCLVWSEAWHAIWTGQRDSISVALMGISALLLSVTAMRVYGISTRNISALKWLEDTHVYSAAIWMQFIGLSLFTKAAPARVSTVKRGGLGQLVAGVVIGAIIASSKMLEPALMFLGKLFSGLVR